MGSKINGVRVKLKKNKWGQSKVAVRLSSIVVRLRQTRSGKINGVRVKLK